MLEYSLCFKPKTPHKSLKPDPAVFMDASSEYFLVTYSFHTGLFSTTLSIISGKFSILSCAMITVKSRRWICTAT